MITHETILKKKTKIPWRIIDDEAVIVHLKSNSVLQLNDVGRFIWESIDGEVNVKCILEKIYNTYDSDKEKICNDGLHFLNHLIDKELVYDIYAACNNCSDSI